MSLTAFNLVRVIFHLNESKHTIAGARWGKSVGESQNWPHNVKSVLSDCPLKAIGTLAKDFWDMAKMNAETYRVGPESFSLEVSESQVEDGRFWQKPFVAGRVGISYNVADLIKKG